MTNSAQQSDEAVIHDRGRGPEIKGTRLTVYAMFELIEEGWTAGRLAEFFRITAPQATIAIEYVHANREAVAAELENIKARHARGNPPEVEARLAKSREELLARLNPEQRRRWEKLHRVAAAG